MKRTPENAPPDWDYNPSAWSQRMPIIILAVIGFFIAGYLSLYQFRITGSAWDPFFGNQTEKILDSPVSKVLPIPDAALGAFGYLLDAVTGAIGGKGRWKTLPWMVLVFGVFVGPLGAISIMLVIFQPVLYGAWCTLCLTTALISVIMIGPAMDEFLASLQYLKKVKREGHSVWKAFWGTETPEMEEPVTRDP